MYTVAIKDWLWSYLEVNPVQLIRKPKVDNVRNRRLYEKIKIQGLDIKDYPKDEITWIISATQSKYLPSIVLLAVETAMRRSELVSLSWEHVNFESSTIYVPVTKNSSSRYVPMSPLAKQLLIKLAANKASSQIVFNISTSAVTRAFIRACRKAQARYLMLCERECMQPDTRLFEGLRFHDLRHEAISRLATVYELHELAKVTGHIETRMLLRYYHPNTQELSQKLERSYLGKRQLKMMQSAS